MTVANTIPASAIVAVTPGVIGAGGTGLDLIGLLLTNGTQVPIGSILSFPDAPSVSKYFGASSNEYDEALTYFNGFDNSSIKPGALLFTQYPTAAVAAYTRGASVASLTLAQLQALSGTIGIVMDGYSHPAASVNLSSATSFSSAAALIQTGLNSANPTLATFTASIAGTTLSVTALATGTIGVGQTVTGTGVATSPIILSQLTGTLGGTGTYQLSVSGTINSSSMSAKASSVVVTYDSVSGGFVITSALTGAISTVAYATGTLATSLSLTQALGAVLSQGSAIATPSAFMTAVVAQTQNWVSFMTMFDPDAGVGCTNKLSFALWTSQQNNRYAYIAWDTDITPTLSNAATTSFGYQVKITNAYSGTYPIYESAGESGASGNSLAAFICGAIASIDFTEQNGRVSFAFRSQAGLSASVTSNTAAQNLIANGYNFYGAYATANDNFIFNYPGQISGIFLWLDSYVNQVWLNNALQLALMSLLTQMKSIPYNPQGYGLIRAACSDPINAALNFGAIRPNVPLSAAQAAEVNADAGTKIDDVLSTVGYYLQILPATAQVRANRGSPPCTLWYMDGQSIQQINLASIEVQ